jgi:homoserine dehydrogenase
VILARELGFPVDVEDVLAEPLVPREALAPGSLADLVAALRPHDAELQRRCRALAARGLALRYLVRIAVADGRIALRAGPAEVPSEHRAARLRGVEAYVAVTTERHRELPLVVQGAGVGGALTAGAVLADVFRAPPTRGAR